MTRAALLMIVGMCFIPLGDTAGKLLVQTHAVSPFFVGWSRFLVGALLVLPLLSRAERTPRALVHPQLFLRGALIALGILSILTALRTEPLPNVFAAFFIGPVVSYVLSVFLLGERVTAARTALLAIGFAGVLLVVRPGFGMTPGLGFAVLAGCFYGAYLVSSRRVAGIAPPRALLLSQLVVGAVLLAPMGLAAIPEIDATIAWLLLLSAAASATGNLLLTIAYGLAPATRLAPFVYFQLIAATVLGWTVFGDLPDMLTAVGLVLLVGSGFASFALRR